MQFGFSSLGAPQLTYRETCDLAREFKLDFLELRTLVDRLDLPAYFSEGKESPQPGDPPVLALGTSLRLTEATEPDIEEFAGFVQLAGRLGTKYLRVFGGGADGTTGERITHAARVTARCRERIEAASVNCEMLLETHDGFCSSQACVALNAALKEPLGILWDAHHSRRIAGETPAETWKQLGPLVRHVHFKDSILKPAPETGMQYVLPGAGDFPSEEFFAVLRTGGYRGGVSLEWEKKWHSELEPLPEALKAFGTIIARHRGK